METVKKVVAFILYNLKWLLLPLTLYWVIVVIEKATDSYGLSGSETEYAIWTLLLVIVNVLLFVLKGKYKKLIDYILSFWK